MGSENTSTYGTRGIGTIPGRASTTYETQGTALANQLRQERLNKYGVKGKKPGNPGYVKDGWKNAFKRATELYYRETGKTPKAKKPHVTSQRGSKNGCSHLEVPLLSLSSPSHTLHSDIRKGFDGSCASLVSSAVFFFGFNGS